MFEKNFKEQQVTLPTQLQWHGPGLRFDTETIIIQGVYDDELSAHRAKGIWTETLESYFLLESGQDFLVSLVTEPSGNRFMLRAHFVSACARYAFWRLTNSQAPETQYILETAHIPICESRHDDILSVPDMRPLNGNQHPNSFFDFDGLEEVGSRGQWNHLKQLVTTLISKLTK